MLKGEWGTAARVVAIGPAGENTVNMAIVLAENDATGSKGLGAVMGAKKLKAIVAMGTRKGVRVAEPAQLHSLIERVRGFQRSPHLVLNGVDVLATGRDVKKDPCYGCLGRCVRVSYTARNGTSGKYMCSSAFFYEPYARRYYQDTEDISFFANRLCDDWGVDTMPIDAIIYWLQRCHKSGILTDASTGIPISKLGSLEFIETLVRKVSLREGFGDLLASGLVETAKWVGKGAEELLPSTLFKGDQPEMYGPRLYNTHALLYATEISHTVAKWLTWLKGAEGSYLSAEVLQGIARRFWGGEVAADFTTIEGKALAAVLIQNRQYAKECLGLCDFLWPLMEVEHTDDHAGDPSLESRILSAVTGIQTDEEGLNAIGERVFNLQRAVLVREGHNGRGSDVLPVRWHTVPVTYDSVNTECLVPGSGGRPVSRKGAVMDRGDFEAMKDEYYGLRGWDVARGLQTRETLERLGLREIADDLERRGLLANTG
ncbi:MAG: hypothetical protein NTU41_04195 [Chloroflexi bacterium]|nr:hypothetical protein [Chloroflexota bacterium]